MYLYVCGTLISVIVFIHYLPQYEDGEQSVADLAALLVSMLDTPEKLHLLTEVRSVLHPADLIAFDEAMAPHEIAALQWKSSSSRLDQDTRPDSALANHYNLVLTDIQNANGHKALRKTPANSQASPAQHPTTDLGAFADSAAQSLLHKAAPSSSEQDLAGLQTCESFLNWNSTSDNHPGPSLSSSSSSTPPSSPSSRADTHSHNTPVTIEMQKKSPFLGLAVEGGVDTLSQDVRVREIREGGAAFKDGFLKPGFEIVEVDGVRVKGKTNDEAVYTLAKAYGSASDSIKLIVIPT